MLVRVQVRAVRQCADSDDVIGPEVHDAAVSGGVVRKSAGQPGVWVPTDAAETTLHHRCHSG